MSQAVDRSVCRVKLRPGQRSAKAASACFGASGMNNTVFEPSRQTGACDSAEHQVAEVKDSLHDQQTRLLDEADAKIGSLEAALAALVGSTQFDRRALQFLLHELKAARGQAKLSSAELDGRTAEVATLQSTVCRLQQHLAQVMRQAAEGEASEIATRLLEKMRMDETQQPDIPEALTAQHALMTGVDEGRQTLDRVVSDLQAEEAAQHAVHTNASDAPPSEHGLQQQVDRLQQELAKSEQRAEGDHASVQTLTAKVESLMGERMELHREVFLLRQKLRDTAAKVAERSRLECRVAFLEHQLHAADAAAASSSHQMPDGPSTPHTQDWHSRVCEQDQCQLRQQSHQAWSDNDHVLGQRTGQEVPYFGDTAGDFPVQWGLIQLPDISGCDPSMPLFYHTSQLLGDGCSGRVYRAGSYDDMLQSQAVLAVKVVHDAENGWRCMMDEVATLELVVGSPRLLQYYGCGCDLQQGFIVTELLPGSSLFDAVHDIYRQPPFDEAKFRQTLLTWTVSVFQAVQEVHALGIAHRDVKLDNFCFKDCPDDSQVLVLLDFGHSLRLHEGVRAEFGVSGTLPYMAGELLSKNSSGGLTERPRLDQHVEDHQAVDVWAAACTAYAILTGLDLFSYDLSQPEAEQKADIYKQQAALEVALRNPTHAEHAALGEMWNWGLDAVSFYQATLCSSFADRLTASQALEHPFLDPF